MRLVSVLRRATERTSPSSIVARRTESGFTLVELLVVIGIIAVLISLLLPSLARARQSAQSVNCMSNLKQAGMAIQMYLNDNKGRYMPYWSLSLGGWHQRLVAKPDTWPHNAIGYLQTFNVFFCPSHELIQHPLHPMLAGESDRDYAVRRGYISYGISMGFTLDFKQAGWPEVPCNVSNVKNPTEKVLLADAKQEVYGHGMWYLHPYYIAPSVFESGVVATRHPNLGVNVLWADYHVTTVHQPVRGLPASIYDQNNLTDYLMPNSRWDRR